jgi:hypothetical protein
LSSSSLYFCFSEDSYVIELLGDEDTSLILSLIFEPEELPLLILELLSTPKKFLEFIYSGIPYLLRLIVLSDINEDI